MANDRRKIVVLVFNGSGAARLAAATRFARDEG